MGRAYYRRPVRRLLPLIALLLLAPGGCGDDDDPPGRTVTAKAGETLPVVADEYSFDPETIVVAGAGELTVELENKGALAHNLRVFDGGDEIGGTPTFVGGDARTGEVSVEPGEYEIVCTVGDHAELGMTGKLTVR
jgi:plastocyanin